MRDDEYLPKLPTWRKPSEVQQQHTRTTTLRQHMRLILLGHHLQQHQLCRCPLHARLRARSTAVHALANRCPLLSSSRSFRQSHLLLFDLGADRVWRVACASLSSVHIGPCVACGLCPCHSVQCHGQGVACASHSSVHSAVHITASMCCLWTVPVSQCAV
jgi:hypothetical protein